LKLTMVPKGTKFPVLNDREKPLYTIKKKRLGTLKYILIDKNGYVLYVLQPNVGGKRPSFKVYLNEKVILDIACTSMFLEPSIEVTGENRKYTIKSTDRKDFNILLNGEKIGRIKILSLMNEDRQVEMEVEDKRFDDAMPLFALATELTFSQDK